MRAGEVQERDGRLTLDLEDPEGQRLSLVDDGGAGEANPWEGSPVPAEHQVRGLGPIMLSVPRIAPTDAVLARDRHAARARVSRIRRTRADTVHVYEMGPGGPGAELHVAEQRTLRAGARRARAACITSRSVRRTRTTTRGRIA